MNIIIKGTAFFLIIAFLPTLIRAHAENTVSEEVKNMKPKEWAALSGGEKFSVASLLSGYPKGKLTGSQIDKIVACVEFNIRSPEEWDTPIEGKVKDCTWSATMRKNGIW